MSTLKPVTIIIRGEHDTGRTTIATLFKLFLEENGFQDIAVVDTPPLPAEQKEAFQQRFARIRSRPIRILVETIDGSTKRPT